MRWFGKPYGCAYEADTERAEVPVGDTCHWCRQPVLEDDTGLLVPYMRKGPGLPHQTEAAYHWECHMRSIVGGLNHLRGTCTCCGGGDPPDPPWMSLRDAARAAVKQWQQQRISAASGDE